ncbi:MAG: exodeoxyribonuclease VII small subunit [Mucinivorans sp.]
MEQEMTYAQAIARVEQIIRAMQDASLDVDNLGAMVAEATGLIAMCQGKLKKAETEVKKALGDE